MPAIARLLSSSYSSASTFFHNDSYSISSQTFSRPLNSKTRASSLKLQPKDQGFWLVKDRDNLEFEKMETGEKIQEIHCTSEYDKGLQLSQEKLRKSGNYAGEKNIEKIPYFVFYKKMENIHEEEGFQPQKLVSNILYYGHDAFSPVVQLQSGEDLEKLIKIHKIDHKLIVVNVGMRQCIPCVKIYPSVLKLASQMADRVVFARMNADENDSCMKMLREIDVSRVPAFLFLKNGSCVEGILDLAQVLLSGR
ncbi:UNVERIFIED_CONTAM: Thioredoxin-like protein CDSP32, chloroplastic [Sesamum angustifolium]|uniref:Thioredoxin-like protein CDSP32, chloroplastic n=1 Tax=Sesamum angustifolium TaxID=2727405 RepID=A0AAW2QDC8_9LAMI